MVLSANLVNWKKIHGSEGGEPVSNRVHSRVVEKAALTLLEERGVTLEAMAEIVYELQIPFSPYLKMEACLESVEAVLKKESYSMRF
jgi:hypothetical protein